MPPTAGHYALAVTVFVILNDVIVGKHILSLALNEIPE